MIELHDVRKTYRQGDRRVEALCGVDLTIDKPGYFAVMGRSGSGKSTLLHLLAGLDQPDEGRVVVNGNDLSQLNDKRLTAYRRCGVGVVFQQFNLIPTLTARQNVALPGVIDGRPRKWINERVDELLETLGMTARASHRPEALSGGEQQRVAIARALVFGPSLLLADEPTGNLDSSNAQQLWTLLGALAQQHDLTVLMVTHEPAAAAFCEHVYVIGDGRLKGQFEVNVLDTGGVASRYRDLDR
jgi:putative ABC transport system ATP-binding protein